MLKVLAEVLASYQSLLVSFADSKWLCWESLQLYVLGL